MNVITGSNQLPVIGWKGTRVKTFTIRTDGDIVAIEGGQAADTLAAGTDAFHSERELHDVTAAVPLTRLVEVWNRNELQCLSRLDSRRRGDLCGPLPST